MGWQNGAPNLQMQSLFNSALTTAQVSSQHFNFTTDGQFDVTQWASIVINLQSNVAQQWVLTWYDTNNNVLSREMYNCGDNKGMTIATNVKGVYGILTWTNHVGGTTVAFTITGSSVTLPEGIKDTTPRWAASVASKAWAAFEAFNFSPYFTTNGGLHWVTSDSGGTGFTGQYALTMFNNMDPSVLTDNSTSQTTWIDLSAFGRTGDSGQPFFQDTVMLPRGRYLVTWFNGPNASTTNYDLQLVIYKAP